MVTYEGYVTNSQSLLEVTVSVLLVTVEVKLSWVGETLIEQVTLQRVVS